MKMFRQLYQIDVWFKQDEGTEKKTFNLSKIQKLTTNHIKGLDMNGKLIEIRTARPFDYHLKQIK